MHSWSIAMTTAKREFFIRVFSALPSPFGIKVARGNGNIIIKTRTHIHVIPFGKIGTINSDGQRITVERIDGEALCFECNSRIATMRLMRRLNNALTWSVWRWPYRIFVFLMFFFALKIVAVTEHPYANLYGSAFQVKPDASLGMGGITGGIPGIDEKAIQKQMQEAIGQIQNNNLTMPTQVPQVVFNPKIKVPDIKIEPLNCAKQDKTSKTK